MSRTRNEFFKLVEEEPGASMTTIEDPELPTTDELTQPPPEVEVEAGDSQAMNQEVTAPTIKAVLDSISAFMDKVTDMGLLQSIIDGTEIVDQNSERKTFNYISKQNYTDFTKLMGSCSEMMSSISKVSFEAKRLLGDIELSRKLKTPQKESYRFIKE
jgi:hypothetical protein